jgi:hypothetical protein
MTSLGLARCQMRAFSCPDMSRSPKAFRVQAFRSFSAQASLFETKHSAYESATNKDLKISFLMLNGFVCPCEESEGLS